ncbi:MULTISPECIES: PE family protein [Mycobacterium]|uniref:PE domain-containing protein n=1 Tax=Mycobacterium kiyosense TaxID=2871094 RepID=A0A9P3Q3Z3_9MYCO|nr:MULTISPECIES: PE family protein [Mycobacterium]BDB39930.1 hypothetical protein IWGMT90018_03760 [Mycobacterium kiyosense]BDE11781.1 hypothetical protein MKCMC460_06410 [Mycobacterium sp. 20KCMC460]GLB84773.1 hypothetical protein SRL2020028_40290 [Mycobacterium kiyosense]GLB87980.1 hypothetical protein SRL2020130_07970 [Mycobacterium kiyosense]GLB95462.1 hypothetical protein SRL2020226_22380 [Mycobacterium kiyosense]
MSYLAAHTDVIATAAVSLEDLQALIGAASSAASAPTTGLAAAAADEVSTAIANLFAANGRECQAVIAQATAFQSEFTRAMAAGGLAYWRPKSPTPRRTR